MNRILKFRAWDKGRGRMLPVVIGGFKLWDDALYFSDGLDDALYFSDGLIDMYEVNEDEFELMQYTGLKDRQGNEIYEGDILEIVESHIALINEYKGKKLEVVFGSGYFQCKPIDFKDNNFWTQLCDLITKVVVIGNIYENKDLKNIR